jgi:hypothetical protein
VSRSAWRVVFYAALVVLAVQLFVYRIKWWAVVEILTFGAVPLIVREVDRRRRALGRGA